MNRRLPEVPEGAAGNAFSRLLDRYLRDGVRPKPGRRWTNEAFATACNTNERTVRFWRSGTHLPNDLGAIETALFGDAPPDPSPRQALRDTYDLAKSDRVSGSTTPGQQPLSAQPTRPDRCFGRDARKPPRC